jgi:glucose/arabinose dehydrogenase
MRQFYFLKSSCLFLLLSVLLVSFQSNAQPVIGFHSVVTGLSSPVDVVNAGDGSNRLFVVQQPGTIKVYDASLNPLGDFLTVAGNSFNGGERGLLSLAFHPGYKTNGYFFVYYTNANGDVEVARYHTPAATPNVADPASKQVIITIPHPVNNNHNGGKLNFGPDGYLYFATGDGGGSGDAPNNAQNGAVLLGKMIRINVTTSATAPFYTIPPDNPFLAAGDNIMDEIWAFGLRNPFRWSFDRLTHDMWIGDVGQDAWEEIDFRSNGNTGGLNYGWHCIEGTHPYNGGCTLSAAEGTYAPPLFDYPHNNATGGFAVIGGYVYRGTVNPAMYGYYIFADEVSHNVWLLPPGGGAADTIQFTNILAGISGFGEAENGELYTVSVSNGQLYNVVATSNSTLPVKLVSFAGTAGTGFNELAWQTTDEQQLRQFEIEYSSDAVHFQQAGIAAAANSGNYYFKHSITTTQKLYYRLKMVDLDGKAVYSKTIIIAANNLQGKNFVTPTIITNRAFTLNLETPFSNLQVINMDGKIMYSESISNRTGKINVSLPGVPAGQYLVRLYSNEKQMTQKIVVQ